VREGAVPEWPRLIACFQAAGISPARRSDLRAEWRREDDYGLGCYRERLP
jgi:hypothetical protein